MQTNAQNVFANHNTGEFSAICTEFKTSQNKRTYSQMADRRRVDMHQASIQSERTSASVQRRACSFQSATAIMVLGSFPDWKRLENRFFCPLHKKQQAPLLEATAQTMNFNLKSLALLQANLKRISGKSRANKWMACKWTTAWNGFSVCSSLWSLAENLCTDSVLQSTGKVSLCQRASQRAIGMRMTWLKFIGLNLLANWNSLICGLDCQCYWENATSIGTGGLQVLVKGLAISSWRYASVTEVLSFQKPLKFKVWMQTLQSTDLQIVRCLKFRPWSESVHMQIQTSARIFKNLQQEDVQTFLKSTLTTSSIIQNPDYHWWVKNHSKPYLTKIRLSERLGEQNSKKIRKENPRMFESISTRDFLLDSLETF